MANSFKPTFSNAIFVHSTKTLASFVRSEPAPLYCSQFVAMRFISDRNSAREWYLCAKMKTKNSINFDAKFDETETNLNAFVLTHNFIGNRFQVHWFSNNGVVIFELFFVDRFFENITFSHLFQIFCNLFKDKR